MWIILFVCSILRKIFQKGVTYFSANTCCKILTVNWNVYVIPEYQSKFLEKKKKLNKRCIENCDYRRVYILYAWNFFAKNCFEINLWGGPFLGHNLIVELKINKNASIPLPLSRFGKSVDKKYLESYYQAKLNKYMYIFNSFYICNVHKYDVASCTVNRC